MIVALMKEHVKFLIACRMSLSFVRSNLEPIYDRFRSLESYDETRELYCRTIRTEWGYRQHRPYKKDVFAESRRVYLHYYYDIDRAAEEEKAFDRRLAELKGELESGRRVHEHDAWYRRYFDVSSTPKRGVKVTVKEDAVALKKRYLGFLVLLSSEKMDATMALDCQVHFSV